jgi:hypothetical protein
VPYQVTVQNLSATLQTVMAVTFVRHPDGIEGTLEGPDTFTLAAGASLTRTFTESVPPSVPPAQLGAQRPVGRVATPGFGHFDEAEILYDLMP